MTASVRPSTSTKRPWAVERDGKLVELHSTEEAAQKGADSINRVCTVCRRANGLHTQQCAISCFEVDPDFGSEEDEDRA